MIWGSHPIRSKRLSFLWNFQTGSETHTASHSRGTGGSLLGGGGGGKVAMAWGWPLTSN